MNVEELLSLVRACIFQDEPTFLEGFRDAADTAVFCAGWCCESCCDAAARESLAKNGLCMRVWMTAFGGEAAVRGLERAESSMPDATKGFVASESQR
jgi:hypothetical protein